MEAMLFIAVVCAAAIQLLSASSIPSPCARGEFFNRDVMDCVTCSKCPASEVTLRLCWKDQDTVCGTLGMFQFRQSQRQPIVSSDDLQPETVTSQLPVQVAVAEDVSGDRWFTITVVLVGFLVVLCIIGVILLFITCYVCKKTKRDIVCDPICTSSLMKPDELTGEQQIQPVVTET